MRSKLRILYLTALACMALSIPTAAAQASQHLYAGSTPVPLNTRMTMTSTNPFTVWSSAGGTVLTCSQVSIYGTYAGAYAPMFVSDQIKVTGYSSVGTGVNGSCTNPILGGGYHVSFATTNTPADLCYGMAATTSPSSTWGMYPCAISNGTGQTWNVQLVITTPSGQNCYYTGSTPNYWFGQFGMTGNIGTEPLTLSPATGTAFKNPSVPDGCFYGAGGLYLGNATYSQQFIVREESGVNVHTQ